jgi:hypothetical protein
MNIKILNYTGVSIRLKWGTNNTVVACNTESDIQLETSKAKLTRFHAKYKSVVEAPIQVKGQINVIFETAKYEQTLVLGAFIEGVPRYIGCLAVNDSGKYFYTEYPRKKLVDRYPYAKFFNISVDLYTSSSFMAKMKKIYNTTMGTTYCENRDGPMCDKVFGVPMLVLIFIILLVFIITIVVVVTVGYVNKKNIV